MDQAPTLGRIVHYRQARGSHAWLAAIVTCDESSYVSGFFANPETDGDRLRLNNGSMRDHSMTVIDRDGEAWVPPALPALKPGRVHLQVFSPMGQNYHEFNVEEGTEPGNWRWPPRV